MAGSNSRREAAACVERGIERYAEGQFAAAQRELEAALSLHPGHPRALECLGWVREIASGRRPPSSDKYAAIEVDDYGPEPLQPTRAGIPTRSTGTRIPSVSSSQQVPAQPRSSLADRPTNRTMLGITAMKMSPGPVSEAAATQQMSAHGRTEPLPEAPVPAEKKPSGQLDESPESVTREWSAIATSSLPQLDVPELSEEQIANLLDMDRSQGITLSAGKLDVSEIESDDDDIDRTNVLSASQLEGEEEPERVYEMVAEPEDDEDDDAPSTPFGLVRPPAMTPPDPMLTPLAATPSAPVQRARVSSTSLPSARSSQQLRAIQGGTPTPRVDQTSDDAPSLPTNPFVQQKLASLAQLLAGPSGLEQLEAALRRGDPREIFDLAEQLAERGAGGRADEELLVHAYEAVIGNLGAIPRFGKATNDLDARSAFLLSRIDGATSIDDLLDVSGMPRRDALRVLARLVHAGSVVT